MIRSITTIKITIRRTIVVAIIIKTITWSHDFDYLNCCLIYYHFKVRIFTKAIIVIRIITRGMVMII